MMYAQRFLLFEKNFEKEVTKKGKHRENYELRKRGGQMDYQAY